jgi:uncharacterized protein YdhG (YjbR/CyaY superfamily)
MAAKKRPTKGARNSAAGRTRKGFTAEERAAMRNRVQELKAESSSEGKAEGESSVLEKIAAMAPHDRAMAERLHVLIKTNAPVLAPRLWYGMPAYAKGGDVREATSSASFRMRKNSRRVTRRSASATKLLSTKGRCGLWPSP